MSFAEALERYLEHRGLLGLSPKTVALDRTHLTFFSKCCAERGLKNLEEISRDEVVAFHQRLVLAPGRRGRPRAPATVCSATKAVSLFFRWALEEELVLVNPAEELHPKRPAAAPVRVPTVREMMQLLGAPDRSTAIGLRDRAVLELLYVAGLRRGECHRLDVQDLDFGAKTMRVRRAKGGTQRQLPFSPGLEETLLHYLELGRPRLRPVQGERALLLSSQSGERLDAQSVAVRLRVYARRLGLRLHPHSLRHAFATHMLEGGADLLELAALLGHRRMSSTQGYTRVNPTELCQEHARTHPRATREERP